ncbi:MAG: thioredoxin family protein [Flavobacteriaceae bacterium]|uniref:thioredoxin family protein n=1 Tax=Flavobacterium sp. UBA6195 TaxID=1946554 RepID=UPI000FBD8972|nr:thioredoxin family protein [Flavobacterium sp. UBA6195]RTL13215.1 MAG: thioredoxin family protein [Flavobacteriaceae bacterium]TXI67364.1 MAG: thioredoxin family protein [Flavobacterium sp.]
MKKLFLSILLLFSAFSFSQDWKYNFEEAKQIASEEGKNIIIVFSGSDWCAPCIKLDKNIWQSEVFQKEASKEWIIVRADFPRKKANTLSKEQTEHNRMLADKFNQEGSFPLVVILDKNGKLLGKMGFKNVSPEEYIKMIHAFDK